MLFALEAMRATGAHMLEPAGDLQLDFLLGHAALFEIVADEVGDRRAHAGHFVRQREHVLVTAVPGDEVHVQIDERHALVDVLDGKLQQVAAEGEPAVGLVEHGDDLLERHRIPLRPARHEHACRRGADHARNRALGHGEDLGVSRIAVAITCAERLARPLLADKLGEQQADVGDTLGGGEGGPRSRGRRADEGRRLRGIDQRFAAQRRTGPESRRIGAEAHQHARDQWIGMDEEYRHLPRGGREDEQHQPAGKTCQQAANHTDLVAVPRDHAEHESGCKLRHGGKGQCPETGKVRRVAEAEIDEIGEKQQRGDDEPADHQQAGREPGPVTPALEFAPEHQRRDEVVGDHRRKSHAGDHDHAGRGGKTADEDE